MKRLFLLLFIVLSLANCRIPMSQKVAAVDLTDHGLLVGTISGGSGSFNNINDWHHIKWSKYNLNIDDRLIIPEYYGRTFIVALPPGAHKLVRMEGHGKNLYLNQEFTIRPGKIVSLGGLFLREIPGTKQRGFAGQDRYKFHILHIENSEIVEQVFKKARPDIYSRLADKAIYKADRTYLSKKQLDKLRMEIAVAKFVKSSADNIRQRANHEVIVTGNIGTAGWISTDHKGTPQNFRPLPLNILENVVDCDSQGDRYACIIDAGWIDDTRYRRVGVGGNERRLQNLELAGSMIPRAVHLFGEDGIAVGCDGFYLSIRTGGAADWKTIQQPDANKTAYSHYAFADVDGGFYTYFAGGGCFLTFTDTATGEVTPVDFPEDFDCGEKLLATSKGIILGPDARFLSDSRVHLRSRNGDWSTILFPQSGCLKMERNSNNPDDLIVSCGAFNPDIYRSTDGGYTWDLVTPNK